MNSFKFSVLFTIIILSGCVSPQQKARNEQMISQAEERLETAKKNALITCDSKQSCDKAFSLAKIFVNNNADMKIQFSDDTVAYTYNPIEPGKIGLRVTKTPLAGDSSKIELVASCKGISSREHDPALYSHCAEKIESVYIQFMAIH